jgi:hypothetical protein
VSQVLAPKRCRDCGTTDQNALYCAGPGKPVQTICRPCKNARVLKHRATPAGRTNWLLSMRRSRLSKFGITPAQYDLMFEAQGGLCAICKKECPSGRNLAVDHDHETGAVRALLCVVCNRNLGVYELFRRQAEGFLAEYGNGNPHLARSPELGELPPRRRSAGSDMAAAKITEEQVRELRARYSRGGETQKTLAHAYGISQISVSRIVRGVSWRHVA